MSRAKPVTREIPPLKDLSTEIITEDVSLINSQCDNSRIRFLVERLVIHLRAFRRETRLPSGEWKAGIDSLVAVGQISTELQAEMILLSDTLGLSMLVDSIDHPRTSQFTEGTVVRPFHTHDAPVIENGYVLHSDPDATSSFVLCTIKDSKGNPLNDITCDVWEDHDKHLYTWIRTPTWMTPGFAPKYSGPDGPGSKYTEEQKERFRNDPDYYLKHRKVVETQLNASFWVAFLQNTPEQKAVTKLATEEMVQKLSDNEVLKDKLIPKHFPVGCKRPTPGNGFLEAITASNVTTFTEPLTKFTAEGFFDPDDNEHKVDVLILATGFNTTWVPRFPIVANGVNLQDDYRKNPLSYLGVAAPGMPNYFTFYGPYGPLGQGSALYVIEAIDAYIEKMIKKLQTENIKSYTPKRQVALDFQEHADLYNQRTVWAGNCRSWFKCGKVDGRVMQHPGTRTQYFELISSPRYEDYEIEDRHRNVWYFLGNGFSTRDFDGRDLTWYLGLVDGKDVQQDFDV